MAKKKSKKNQKKENKKDDLNDLISSMQEKYGEGAIMRLGDNKKVNVETVPSGSFSLDLALGVGGLPKGRVIEIYGPESSGKTTLALHAIAEMQKQKGKAAFIDAEHALDPDYARKIGVNIKDLVISQPDTGEEALNIMESLVKSGVINIIVVDSVAALTPRDEIDGEMGARHIGLQARLMSQALRKITSIASKSGTVIIFINQIRMKIGVMYGNPETTPGGRALKFYSSVRLDIRRRAQIKQKDEIIGNRTKVKVVKNKVAAPFKIAEFDIYYGEGISYEGDILNTAVNYGVVKRAGASYRYNDESIAVGFDNARKELKEDKKLLNTIKKETLKVIKDKEKEKEKESKNK
ncbi:MAG: recombinase RecA [Candidatus Paceibacterota bacterium]